MAQAMMTQSDNTNRCQVALEKELSELIEARLLAVPLEDIDVELGDHKWIAIIDHVSQTVELGRTMANISSWLMEFEKAQKEQIQAILIGENRVENSSSFNHIPEADLYRILDRDTGIQLLDKEFENEHGLYGGVPMYAWTSTKVIFIFEYDGKVRLQSAPRNPVSTRVQFCGWFS